jgi:hypothetical protein
MARRSVRERSQDVAGKLIEAGQVRGVKEFRGEEIGNGVDHPEKDWLVQTRTRQDDDHGMSGRASGHVRVPKADRDATRSIGLAFLRVGQGAVGEQNMEGLAIRAGDHGHGLAQAGEETRFSVTNAVRAKIEIPMGNALFDLGIVLHGSALRVKIKSRQCAGGWETHLQYVPTPNIID